MRAPVRIRIMPALMMLCAACTLGLGDQHPGRRGDVEPIGDTQVHHLEVDQPRTWDPSPARWSVTLSWQAPNADVDHYEVQRNGIAVAERVAEPSFTDPAVEPEHTYVYSVMAIDVDGQRSMPAKTKVKTNGPKLADARLEGKFLVKMHATSSYGLSGGTEDGAFFFLFDPRCHAGACAVRWSVQKRQTEATLPHDGARYAGTIHQPFQIHDCHGGSMKETAVAPGCMTAGIHWTLQGMAQV
jgi:hypothetical protein